MTDQPTAAEQLAAIAIVEQLATSVQHLHPSYRTVRAGMEWLRGHVEQRDRNRAIGQQFAQLLPGDVLVNDIDDERFGLLIRDAVHAAGLTIVPQPSAEEAERA